MKDWYACPDWCCSTFFEEKDHQTNSWSVQGRKIAQRGEGVTTMGGAGGGQKVNFSEAHVHKNVCWACQDVKCRKYVSWRNCAIQK